MSKNALSVIMLLAAQLVLSAFAFSAPAAMGKPRPPVEITIAPVQSQSTAKPGSDLDFRVTAVPAVDGTEMRIQCSLSEGVELAAGELAWSGPVQKGMEQSLQFSVRMPKKGYGRIIARVEIYAGEELLFTSTAEHELSDEPKEKSRQPVGIRKDKKGQTVEEYR